MDILVKKVGSGLLELLGKVSDREKAQGRREGKEVREAKVVARLSSEDKVESLVLGRELWGVGDFKGGLAELCTDDRVLHLTQSVEVASNKVGGGFEHKVPLHKVLGEVLYDGVEHHHVVGVEPEDGHLDFREIVKVDDLELFQYFSEFFVLLAGSNLDRVTRSEGLLSHFVLHYLHYRSQRLARHLHSVEALLNDTLAEGDGGGSEDEPPIFLLLKVLCSTVVELFFLQEDSPLKEGRRGGLLPVKVEHQFEFLGKDFALFVFVGSIDFWLVQQKHKVAEERCVEPKMEEFVLLKEKVSFFFWRKKGDGKFALTLF